VQVLFFLQYFLKCSATLALFTLFRALALALARGIAVATRGIAV